MGAGVVKPQPNGQGFRIHIHTGGTQFQSGAQTMSSNGKKCEECGTTFSAFKKKKWCKDCARAFCSTCSVQVNGSSPRQQQCKKCDILMAGTFTRRQLKEWKVKDLKALLDKQNVNTSTCKEKNDLIDLIFTYFGNPTHANRQEHDAMVEQLAERMRREDLAEQRSSNTAPSSSSPRPSGAGAGQSQAQSPAAAPPAPETDTPAQGDLVFEELQRQANDLQEREAQLRAALDEEEKKEAQPENPRLVLEDIKSEADIAGLSIRDLKRLLVNNFVDYKGCCERWELQDRVKRLWNENEVNKRKAEEQRKISDDPSLSSNAAGNVEDDLCKICMDATIDCVLLECGHMVTCTKCGKQLSECPICRQYVVRAVHTFKV